MTRRPSSVRRRIFLDPHRYLPVLFVVSAVLISACGNATATGSSGSSPEASATSLAASGQPAASVEPSAPASVEPSIPGETAGSNASPGPSASASPSGGSASAAAAACSGSNRNRGFFASMAAAVDWPVYCPVLPDGWFVKDGQYWLAGGGRLEIVYQGPQRAQIALDEGTFCTIQGGCVPPGEDVGATAFDGRDGMLVALDDGSWAIALDREASLSWLLIVTGLDEATARSIAAALVVVGD